MTFMYFHVKCGRKTISNPFLSFLLVSEGKMDRPLPVLVFVHGEDFSYGAGHPYDPSMLVSVGNVIVINFNFRLGILGKVFFLLMDFIQGENDRWMI